MIGMLQRALDQSIISDLSDQGYTPLERSAREISSEIFDEQSNIAGVVYEFFPLIVALLGVSYIRTKCMLGMGYVASLKHTTPLKLIINNSLEATPVRSLSLTATLSG
jgi:hypothetical protein